MIKWMRIKFNRFISFSFVHFSSIRITNLQVIIQNRIFIIRLHLLPCPSKHPTSTRPAPSTKRRHSAPSDTCMSTQAGSRISTQPSFRRTKTFTPRLLSKIHLSQIHMASKIPTPIITTTITTTIKAMAGAGVQDISKAMPTMVRSTTHMRVMDLSSIRHVPATRTTRATAAARTAGNTVPLQSTVSA
jgi:hypothetical protein